MNMISFVWLLIVVLPIISHVDANWITGNLCWSMPCFNGGSCFGSAYTYLCICPIDYTGALCEKRLGICQQNPCGNRGLCIEKSFTSFECRCYYDYIGATCEEHLQSKKRNIWSSLSPTHTQILFNILQEMFRIKGKEKVIPAPKNGQIDFIALLSTSISTTPETVVTTDRIETIDGEFSTQANDTRLENLDSDQNITSTEQSSHFDTRITDDEIVENITTISTELSQLNSSSDTIDDQDIVDLTTSTSIPWLDDENNTLTKQDTINGIINSTESIDLTSTNIDDNEIYSSEQTTTLSLNTSTSSSSSPRATIHHAHGQLLCKLCQQIFSHLSPNTSNSSSILPHHVNKTSNALLSWFNKHLNSTKNSSTTSTLSSLPIDEIQSSSGSLQRIDMDDVLHQMDNYVDDENVHR